MVKTRSIGYALLFFLFTACATYYTKTFSFQEKIQTGQIEKAEKQLEGDKKWEKGKNSVLYYLNRGYVNWLLQNYENSNNFFTIADNKIEDQYKDYKLEALALITNPMVKPYKAEDFETVILNYFKALNYISMNQLDEALVEVKKINIKLNKLNDKYPKHKNRYSKDAFAHLIMGIIYDAKHDYNNAFIAYRNAYEVYKELYVKEFNVDAPEQLKKDILRTAYLTGFYDDVRFYEKEFKTKYVHDKNAGPELVFFWLNGFGPVKAEWSINFTALPGGDGVMTFSNEELGLSFPIITSDFNDNEKAALSDLRFLRIAFPKYVERNPVFVKATLSNNSSKSYQLEMAQNINEIAFKTLHDRMVRELANSIGRLAVKKAMEAIANKQNENLGMLVGLTNALTEKADTRNWQTLPFSISYIRIPLNKGDNNVKLTTYSKQNSQVHDFNIKADNNKTYIRYFHTLDSTWPNIAY